MAAHKLLLIFPLFLTLSAAQFPPPQPPLSLINAADTLANSGFTSMSLTLQIIAPTLPLPSGAAATTALTIFSPPDSAFSDNGQPSLAELLLHFSPISLAPSSLLSLPLAAAIPTLSPSKHLFITSSRNDDLSIDGIRVSRSPIFDDGLVIVYEIDDFFRLNYTLINVSKPNSKTDFQCLKLESTSRFKEASGVLKSRGYSIMASFLDLQIVGFLDNGDFSENNATKWTLFAPIDQDLVRFSGDFPRYFSLFMRHLVPCMVGWSDFDEMTNGTVVSNNVQGFSLKITKDEEDETLMVNGVVITAPDLYVSDWLVIHGIRKAIVVLENEEDGFPFMEEYGDNGIEQIYSKKLLEASI